MQFSFLGLLPHDSSMTFLHVNFVTLFTEPIFGSVDFSPTVFLFSVSLVSALFFIVIFCLAFGFLEGAKSGFSSNDTWVF